MRVRSCIAALAALCCLSSAAAAPALPRGTVYAANERGASISAIDLPEGRIQTIAAPVHPHNVQISRDGSLLFAVGSAEEPAGHSGMHMSGTSDMTGNLLVYDARRLQRGPLASIAVGEHPAHVVADRALRYAYVSLSGENSVAVVDLHTRKIAAKIVTGDFPHGMRLGAGDRELYVANMHGGSVSVIDTAARRERFRIRVGGSPVQVAPSRDGSMLYVSLAAENAVAEVDLSRRAVVRKVRVGANPAQIFLTPRGDLLAANQGTPEHPGTTLSVIALPGMRVVREIAVGKGAHGIASDSTGAFAFVTDAFAGELAVVNLRAYRLLRTYAVGAGPNGVTFRP